MRVAAVVAACLLPTACGPSDAPSDRAPSASPSLSPLPVVVAPTASSTSTPTPAPSASSAASAAPPASASASAPPGAAFVRGPQLVLPIDHCVFDTGGPSCMQALRDEQDELTLRFMLHIVEARAAKTSAEVDKTKVLEIPHPEQAAFCKESGPCGGKRDDGIELDSAYACLTRASMHLVSDPVESSAAHARACRCHAKTFEIPVQGGTGLLGCDNGKLVRWGKAMPVAQAADVELCSQCDPDGGPAACEREIARLAGVDPALSEHVARVHVPRCRTPVP